MAQLVDLPTELQIEIFSNVLSVKHLGNILSINKSTHDQLVQSETFWKNLINNYSKAIGVKSSSTDELFDIANVKNQFLDLIDTKRKQFESLKMTSLKLEYMLRELQYMIRELEAVAQEMKLRNEMGGTTNNQRTNMEAERLMIEVEELGKEKLAVDEQCKKMIID